ncbi:M23 family metallopeptidase [Salimicrobium halophilum]|uniref:Peptidase family M23 n=1 Tax=Salimicrobium halophilum TaxID=86666 RepID=A0A1G8V9Q1_9BACI|nr:M23 family metallopeptidase [Salimicrobium halophilum]SDJ62846.1 Peptidase family M23 [Salimicrobium halophilum]
MKIILCLITLLLFPIHVYAETDIDAERMALYKKTEAVTFLPWHYLAAVDEYERQINDKDTLISLDPPDWFWQGTEDGLSMKGWNRDGDGDGKGSRDSDEDTLYSTAKYLTSNGLSRQDIKIALWNYYEREVTVQSIMNNAKLYETFQTLNLDQHAFPVPLSSNYSYNNTWGDGRGYGGARIHEGTDIFADYSTPVYATTYGVVEMKGWNKYGGWRIGIRDPYNTYHYFAHLSGYPEDLEIGSIVEPGQQIGSVGSTGYGPKGTSGKFPPHLHYGMYKDNGKTEWAHNPYSYLTQWERKKQPAS